MGEPLEYAIMDAMGKLNGEDASKLLNTVQKLQQRQSDAEAELEREVSERLSREETELQVLSSEVPSKPSRGFLSTMVGGLALAGLGLAYVAGSHLAVPEPVAPAAPVL